KGTPYSEGNAKGDAGTALTINFNVVSGSGSDNPPVENPDSEPVTDPDTDPGSATGLQVESYTLINADTDREIKTIVNGETLSLSNLPTKNLNIRANTSSGVVSLK